MLEYDIVVVGAGNGGLTAATLAAQSGRKTLLLERHNVPGGCATSFRRGRFEFEATLQALGGMGTVEKPGVLRTLFADLGVPTIDWFAAEDVHRALVPAPGFDAVLPADLEKLIAALEKLAPGSSQSVRTLLELGKEGIGVLRSLTDGPINFDQLLSDHPDFLRLASHSVQQVMDALQIPEAAQAVLASTWYFLGVPADELDCLQFLCELWMNLEDKPYMPRMRSHEISLAFEQALLQHGGEVWYNTDVARILVEDGKATGVELPDGTQIGARQVICNVHISKALASMLPMAEIPAPMLQLAHARQLGMTVFTLYLGLDRSPEELGIGDYTVYLTPDTDTRTQYEMSGILPDGGSLIVTCLNKVVPDASPAGTTMLFFTTFYKGDPFRQVTPAEHRKLKLEIARSLIAHYENAMGIEIRPYIEQIDTASPASFTRYLNSPRGTAYGYALLPWDTVLLRSLDRKVMEGIANLEFCGASAENGDGYTAAYLSGISAAERALRHLEESEAKSEQHRYFGSAPL